MILPVYPIALSALHDWCSMTFRSRPSFVPSQGVAALWYAAPGDSVGQELRGGKNDPGIR